MGELNRVPLVHAEKKIAVRCLQSALRFLAFDTGLLGEVEHDGAGNFSTLRAKARTGSAPVKSAREMPRDPKLSVDIKGVISSLFAPSEVSRILPHYAAFHHSWK